MDEKLKKRLREELTSKMHDEFTIPKEIDEKHRAGCMWGFWCDNNSSEKEIRKWAKHYSISYETAMKWKDYWLRLNENKKRQR